MSTRRTTRRREAHLFLLWSNGRNHEGEVLADIGRRFEILDLVEVTWSASTFSHNLTRFYATDLPPGSNKETSCGTGPFLAVVVEVRDPRYRFRRPNGRGRLTASSMYDARAHYRALTGGNLIHASTSAAEAERNLALLFARSPGSYLDAGPSLRATPRQAAEMAGSGGWASTEQLLFVLDVACDGAELVSSDESTLTIRVDDVLWWAELVAGGRVLPDGEREVLVAGEPMRLTLVASPAVGLHQLARDLRRRLPHRFLRPRVAAP